MLWGGLQTAIAHIYTRVVIAPLQRLYFQGPRLFGYGFWKGASQHDICAALTNHNSEFWAQHSDACAQIVRRDFQSHVVLFETAAYFFILFLALRALGTMIVYRRRTRWRQQENST